MRKPTRRGMRLVQELIEGIQSADINETTCEYDLVEIVQSIRRTLDVEPDVLEGACLALADYLPSASGPDVDRWRPCLALDGRSLLLRPVRV